jgi:hypothetical protein
MISPAYLYHLERQDAKNIVNQTINSFDWFIFFSFGKRETVLEPQIDLVTMMAELAEKRAVIVDFLPNNYQTKNYLYGTWRSHCPTDLVSDSVNKLQDCYKIANNDEQREALESLFFRFLFTTDRFHSCIAIANLQKNYMIRKNIEPLSTENLVNSLFRFDNLTRNRPASECDTIEVATIFNSDGIEPGSNSSTSRFCLEQAFANFLDSAEDAIDSLNPKSLQLKLSNLNLQTTEKFYKSFVKLSKDIQQKAIETIKKLFSQSRVGLGLKKINLSKNISIFRMRITEKYRIHFRGSPLNPIFINIGPHKLSDFGFIVD